MADGPLRSASLAPGATVGIIGGGQLGRMLAGAAARLGLRSHIYCPDLDSPAFDVAAAQTVASYSDGSALRGFADAVDVITYEFENVPGETARLLTALKPVRPGAAALENSQHRLVEKTFLRSIGVPTAPFRSVGSATELGSAARELGLPAILKTCRFGYDGKGQVTLTPESDLQAAYAAIGGGDTILEGFVRFQREVSVICARGLDGSFAAYPLCENTHRDHILHRTVVPARVTTDCATRARTIARRIADRLDYVGVLAVELFVVEGDDGAETLLVNEIAPRVHNSGHWTEAGALTSQFEQHIRAICGWPLGATSLRGATVEMENLIGADVERWPELLAAGDVALHLYGKSEQRPGRKMGHWTRSHS